MLRWLGAGVLTAITVVVIAAVAAVPLLFVYRSNCPDGPRRDTSYSFVPPWEDLPARCRGHQRGFEVLREELGI